MTSSGWPGRTRSRRRAHRPGGARHGGSAAARTSSTGPGRAPTPTGGGPRKRSGAAGHAPCVAAGSGDPPGAVPALLAAYDGLARLQLVRGCRLLTAGRVAVTDRLHGHVLALLLGLPHVLVADRYGKARSYWDTWTTHRPPTTEWAWTEAEARQTARRLLAGLSAP